MMTSKIALIDGDIVVYRACAAAQDYYYEVIDDSTGEILETHLSVKDANLLVELWSNDTFTCSKARVTASTELSHALYLIKQTILKCVEFCDTNRVKIFLSPEGTSSFRYRAAKTYKYKGNRSEPRPHFYKEAREYLIRKGALINPLLEADDYIGLEATAYQNSTTSPIPVICTIDKDLDQIPGLHFNFVKEELYEVSEEDAHKFYLEQLLTGDNVDNIKGIHGMGPVKARKLLEERGYTMSTVRDKYVEEFDEEGTHRLNENDELIKILQSYEEYEQINAKYSEDIAVQEQIRGENS